MRIMIEIPEEFEKDYTADKFAELFQRCLADMCTCCGNYEQETAEMMENAFAESKIYDPDKVVEQLEKRRMDALRRLNENKGTAFGCASEWVYNAWNDAIEIVKGGGADVN